MADRDGSQASKAARATQAEKHNKLLRRTGRGDPSAGGPAELTAQQAGARLGRRAAGVQRQAPRTWRP